MFGKNQLIKVVVVRGFQGRCSAVAVRAFHGRFMTFTLGLILNSVNAVLVVMILNSVGACLARVGIMGARHLGDGTRQASIRTRRFCG